jgi:hypothetical protein
MSKNTFSLGLTLTLIFAVLIAPVALAKPTVSAASKPTTTLIGMDISYPQCNVSVPTGQAFAIVGVTGGLATTTNPCLANQLMWANLSTGGTSQDKVQLYVNTGNPGLLSAAWPTTNTANNPYGVCDGSDSIACAWQYGWDRANDDVNLKFQPAAATAGISTVAANYTWWLDVEIANSWKDPVSQFNTDSNVAVLEGMTEYFQSVGGTVGVYSTAYQWGQIVGSSVTTSSNLYTLKNWRPAGSTLKAAKQTCAVAPLTAGGAVVMTQYTTNGLDYDYSCVN